MSYAPPNKLNWPARRSVQRRESKSSRRFCISLFYFKIDFDRRCHDETVPIGHGACAISARLTWGRARIRKLWRGLISRSLHNIRENALLASLTDSGQGCADRFVERYLLPDAALDYHGRKSAPFRHGRCKPIAPFQKLRAARRSHGRPGLAVRPRPSCPHSRRELDPSQGARKLRGLRANAQQPLLNGKRLSLASAHS